LVRRSLGQTRRDYHLVVAWTYEFGEVDDFDVENMEKCLRISEMIHFISFHAFSYLVFTEI